MEMDRTVTAERLGLDFDAASWAVAMEMVRDYEEAQYELDVRYMFAVARRRPMYSQALAAVDSRVDSYFVFATAAADAEVAEATRAGSLGLPLLR